MERSTAVFYCPGPGRISPLVAFFRAAAPAAAGSRIFSFLERKTLGSLFNFFPGSRSLCVMRRFSIYPPGSSGRGRETEGAENELPRDALFSNTHSRGLLSFIPRRCLMALYN